MLINTVYLHIFLSLHTWHPKLESLIVAIHNSPNTVTKNPWLLLECIYFYTSKISKHMKRIFDDKMSIKWLNKQKTDDMVTWYFIFSMCLFTGKSLCLARVCQRYTPSLFNFLCTEKATFIHISCFFTLWMHLNVW